MKRFGFIVLSIVIFFIALSSPISIFAAGEPTYNPSILDVSGLTRAPEEVVEPQAGSFVEWGHTVNFLTGVGKFNPFVKKFLDGGTTFTTKSTLKVLNNKKEADNREMGMLLSTTDGAQKYLKLIPDEMEFTNSANYVHCFTDEDGGSDHRPDGGQPSKSKSPGAAALTTSSKWGYSLYSIGTLSMNELDFYSTMGNQKAGLDNGLDCGRQEKAKRIRTYDNGDGNKSEFINNPLLWTAENYFTPEFIQEALACARAPEQIDPKTGKAIPKDCNPLEKFFSAKTEFSTVVAYAAELFKWYGTGPNKENVGYTNMNKPKEMVNNLSHGFFEQEIDLVLSIFSGTKTVKEAVYAYEAGRRLDRDLFDCNRIPKGLKIEDLDCENLPISFDGQDSIPPNETITSSSEAGNIPASACSDSSSGSNKISVTKDLVTKTAAAFNIQSCILDGVAINEGAYIPAECKPNQCGAMGPFQITVGYTHAMVNGQCSKTNTCAQCGGAGGGVCPDAIKYYLPDTDPCDPKQAAEGAAKMLIGKTKYYGWDLTNNPSPDAIIAAGDSYFGSANGVYTDGCSYGERVYQVCNKAYTCKKHNLPSPGSSL